MLAYEEHPVAGALADFVRCVWTFDADVNPAPQPIAPDGCCELIVHVGAPYHERQADREMVQPGALFAGQITQPLTLVAHEAVHVIGVRFHPWATRAFVGVDAAKLTDKRTALSDLHGEAADALLEHVRAAEVGEARREAVLAYVSERLARESVDQHVRAAVEALVAQKEPAAPAALSERQWQRRFKREVGVSMRELQSVFRFRRVFDAVERPGPPGWVEAALTAGYFDQPQMARDFRRYLGMSSRQWAAQAAGLTRALAASETYKKDERAQS